MQDHQDGGFLTNLPMRPSAPCLNRFSSYIWDGIQ